MTDFEHETHVVQ